jgi:ubiquitin-conjugating enzyme E2 Z
MSATKRAVADANELAKSIYADSGIYYFADDSNVLSGYACVFGPQGTPYEDFPAFYSIAIGPTYPFDPPQVKFLTCDGSTRFHPNMYIDGKVCLSILHTWTGPKWASTMRLSTILVTLQSLMDQESLRHEPGYQSGHDEKVKVYSRFVESRCIAYTLWLANKIVDISSTLPIFVKPFEDILRSKIPAILERIEKRLEIRSQEENQQYDYASLPYSMVGSINYKSLREEVVKLKARWVEYSK